MRVLYFYCICLQTTSHMVKITMDVIALFLVGLCLWKIYRTYTKIDIYWIFAFLSTFMRNTNDNCSKILLYIVKTIDWEFTLNWPILFMRQLLLLLWIFFSIESIWFYIILIFITATIFFTMLKGCFASYFFLFKYCFVNIEIYIRILVYILFVAWFIVYISYSVCWFYFTSWYRYQSGKHLHRFPFLPALPPSLSLSLANFLFLCVSKVFRMFFSEFVHLCVQSTSVFPLPESWQRKYW